MGVSVACAQASPAPPAPFTLTLHTAFERAWALQPEAQSVALRKSAADAARTATESWAAEPPALTLQSKMGNQSREYEMGISIPLWLPHERARKAALEEAEQKAAERKLAVTKLGLAALVRGAWWAYQRTQGEWALSQERLESAQKLASDVARRLKAGDLSQADLHQANAAVAQMEAACAEALGARDAALSALNGLVGGNDSPHAESLEWVDALQSPSGDLQHPVLEHLLQQSLTAHQAADLAAIQTRANPELILATTHSREQNGGASQKMLTVGIRIPLGSLPRAKAKQALAQAEAIEAQARADVERLRLRAEIYAAIARLKAAQLQRDALGKNAVLAGQTRTFYEKSFRLGESDFPTRLRVEQEAAQAQRHWTRARMDAAAAASSLRQAWGLLPEHPVSEQK